MQSLSWGQTQSDHDRYYIIANHVCWERTNAQGRTRDIFLPKPSPLSETFLGIGLFTLVFFDILNRRISC